MRRTNKKPLNSKKSGNTIVDYLNSKLTTNNFRYAFSPELTEEQKNSVFGGNDFTGVFRSNRTYLSFLQSGNQSVTRESDQENWDNPGVIMTRSLSEQITPDQVFPNDGVNRSNSTWFKETSNWILRGNRNLNNNPTPIPCALPPAYNYNQDNFSCPRYLEKVIDDGNDNITVADWSAILCEELGGAYCRADILDDDLCSKFCGNNPHPDEVLSWYNSWFFYYYELGISWSRAGWQDNINGNESSRSPMWSYYKYVQLGSEFPEETRAYDWYESTFVDNPGGRNRLCGPGYGAFPATSELLDPDEAPRIWGAHMGAWVFGSADEFVAWCDDPNQCGTCAPNAVCNIGSLSSTCGWGTSDFTIGGVTDQGVVPTGDEGTCECAQVNIGNNCTSGGGSNNCANGLEAICMPQYAGQWTGAVCGQCYCGSVPGGGEVRGGGSNYEYDWMNPLNSEWLPTIMGRDSNGYDHCPNCPHEEDLENPYIDF